MTIVTESQVFFQLERIRGRDHIGASDSQDSIAEALQESWPDMPSIDPGRLHGVILMWQSTKALGAKPYHPDTLIDLSWETQRPPEEDEVPHEWPCTSVQEKRAVISVTVISEITPDSHMIIGLLRRAVAAYQETLAEHDLARKAQFELELVEEPKK